MEAKFDERLLTPKEVADVLRISISTVYAAVREGHLPAVTLWRGKRKSVLRFRRRDIEKILFGVDPGRAGRPRLNVRPKGAPR